MVRRDAERTKRLLREAAAAEFAAYGLHGTTVERIAARAGVNKERLYSYFGDKQELFAAVVSGQLARIASEVPLAGTSAEDFAEFVGRSLDYQLDHPDLGRLVVWEGLSDSGLLPNEEVRAAGYQDKVGVLLQAQSAGEITTLIPAADLLFLMLSLASWWAAAPQLARLITGETDADADRLRRRASVVEAARRLVAP